MNLPAIEIPLREDETGTLRVGSTRITLDVVISALKRGDSADVIADSFPSITLAQVYAVIAYYLQNQISLDNYLQKRALEADKLRQEIEEQQGKSDLAERITLLRQRKTLDK